MTLPDSTSKNAWKIAYQPEGSSDPIGELWIAEGIGRVRVVEEETDHILSAYEAGTGDELPPVSKMVFFCTL